MTIDDEGGDEDGDGGRVNRAFAARLALDEAWPTSPPRVSVAVLAEGLLAGRLNLSPAEWAVVEGDELLRTSWQFLRRSRTLADLPRVAAASTGNLVTRAFGGGTVSVLPSASPGMHYVKIAWQPNPPAPKILLLERDHDAPYFRPLPPLRASKDWLLVCHDAIPADSLLVALMRDPRTSGSFLE